MLKIAAIVVTYNRLQLLKEAVAALKGQLYPVSQIVVINNGCTDGTAEWLNEQTGLMITHQENIGASGGFCTGMQVASGYNPDWYWLMDDDTICHPESLKKLLEKINFVSEPIGFLSSKSIWNDGTPHLMNIPAIKPSFNKVIPFNRYDDKNLLVIETSSFVSLLVNKEAVNKVGLPYKDFFIWGDDQEYTRRITKTGFLGLYCIDSIVHHKTGINYFPDFYNDTTVNLWKHSHGFRNEFYMIKKNRGFLYFMFWLPIKLAYTSMKIIKIRKDNRFKFISVLCSSGWRSIFFNPQIAKLK